MFGKATCTNSTYRGKLYILAITIEVVYAVLVREMIGKQKHVYISIR